MNLLDERNTTFQQKKECINIINFITNNSKEGIFNAFSTLEALVENPGFKPQMLNAEFTERWCEITTSLAKNEERAGHGFYILGTLLENPKFNPEMLNTDFTQEFCDIIGFIIETTGKEWSRDASALLGTLMEDPTFEPEMLDMGLADRLCEVIGSVTNEKGYKAYHLMSIFKKIFRENKDLGPEVLFKYKEGEELAKKLGATNDPIIYLNFAYAITAIGEKETEELYKNNGIEYFARYSKKTLKEVHANLSKSHAKEKPLLLIVSNKNDESGFFYDGGAELEKLTTYYRVVIVETDSEDGFYKRVKSTAKKYGKINTLIVRGHGEPDAILLGKDNEKGKLDLTDVKELKKIQDAFVKEPEVVLDACNAGKDKDSVGAMLSKTWGARLWAAINETESITARYILDKKGKIDGVLFGSESREFLKGIPIKVVPTWKGE